MALSSVVDIAVNEFMESSMSVEDQRMLIGRIERHIDKRVKDAIGILLSNLYGHDYHALKRDVAKMALLDLEDKAPDPSERIKLLESFWWCIDVFFRNDLSHLLDECERVIGDAEGHGKIPFT